MGFRTVVCCLLWNDEAKANIKPIYECRCNGRLQTKRSTRLSHTGLVVELEDVKIKTFVLPPWSKPQGFPQVTYYGEFIISVNYKCKNTEIALFQKVVILHETTRPRNFSTFPRRGQKRNWEKHETFRLIFLGKTNIAPAPDISREGDGTLHPYGHEHSIRTWPWHEFV